MRRIVFIIVIIFFIMPSAFALPLESLLSPARAAQLLLNDQNIVETQVSNPAPRLIPQDTELRQIINRAVSEVKPNMMVEALYLYRKPANYHRPNDSWDNIQKTGVFNQILAISTLTGLHYYSSSRNAMRLFYEYSSVIDGPSTKNPRPDPVFPSVPATLTLFARQKDSTFGDNIYRYDYQTNRYAIYFTQENVTGLSYGIIPIIGRGNLRSVMGFYDCGDTLLIYAVSMSNAFSVPGVSDRISSSFTSRAEAVLTWFVDRLNRHLFIQ